MFCRLRFVIQYMGWSYIHFELFLNSAKTDLLVSIIGDIVKCKTR